MLASRVSSPLLRSCPFKRHVCAKKCLYNIALPYQNRFPLRSLRHSLYLRVLLFTFISSALFFRIRSIAPSFLSGLFSLSSIHSQNRWSYCLNVGLNSFLPLELESGPFFINLELYDIAPSVVVNYVEGSFCRDISHVRRVICQFLRNTCCL